MRTIKFRAWDKQLSTMRYNDIYPKSARDWDEWEQSFDCMLTVIEMDYVLMQFTGLLDKNGKEIYEGDVVSYSRAHYRGKRAGYKGTIVWSTNEPALVIFSRNALEQIQNRGGVYFSMSNSSVKNVEILGNIYENPELLEAIDD